MSIPVVFSLFQQGVIQAGFHNRTDISDWYLLDYLFRGRSDKNAPFDFEEFKASCPLMKSHHPSPTIARFQNLDELGLIKIDWDRTPVTYYIEVTELYYETVIGG
ncbi:MAG: hypothetical protein PHD53_00820 [Methylococcales bacterium]|nr:hypothetical protein [Methylococcales bacterium]